MTIKDIYVYRMSFDLGLQVFAGATPTYASAEINPVAGGPLEIIYNPPEGRVYLFPNDSFDFDEHANINGAPYGGGPAIVGCGPVGASIYPDWGGTAGPGSKRVSFYMKHWAQLGGAPYANWQHILVVINGVDDVTFIDNAWVSFTKGNETWYYALRLLTDIYVVPRV